MKVLAYVALLVQTIVIAYLCMQLSNHPFNTRTMQQAYRAGCLISNRPIYQKDIIFCDKTSITFGQTLTKLMERD